MEVEKRILLFLFLSSILFGYSLTITPAYLSNIGFTPLDYGFLNAVRSAAGLVSSLAAGIFVDYIGALPVVVISLALCAAGFGSMSIPSKPLIFLGATALSLGGAAQHVSMDVLISRVFDAEHYESIYSKSYSITLVGSSIGGFAGWIPTLVSSAESLTRAYSASLALTAVLIMLTALPLSGVSEHRFGRDRVSASIMDSLKGFKELSRGTPLYLLIAELIVSMGASMSVRMAGFYFVKKFHVQSNALGTLNGATNLAMAALAMAAPRLSARVGHPIAAYIAMCSLSIPMLVAMTYAPSFTTAAAIYISRTALMNAAAPLYTAFTMRVVSSEVRGKMSSAMIFTSVAGAVAGSIAGGILMNIDLDAPFRATAAVYTIYLLFLYTFIVRRKKLK